MASNCNYKNCKEQEDKVTLEFLALNIWVKPKLFILDVIPDICMLAS